MKLHPLTVVLVVVAGASTITAVCVPNLIEARKHGNEAAAIGALKTLGSARTLFREGDEDGAEALVCIAAHADPVVIEVGGSARYTLSPGPHAVQAFVVQPHEAP